MQNQTRQFAIAILGCSLLHATCAHGDVISGTHEYRVGSGAGGIDAAAWEFGDGTNHVTVVTSLGSYNPPVSESVWFYGQYAYNFNWEEGPIGPALYDTEVALVHGVSDPYQIADASIYEFFGGPLGHQSILAASHAFADDNPAFVFGLVILRNINTGHYGAVRVDDLNNLYFMDPVYGFASSDATVTWWFQTDGTGNFTVPTPSALFAIGVAALWRSRRRR